MTGEGLKRTGWVMVLAAIAILGGCRESAERKAVQQAQSAEKSATDSMMNVVELLASDTRTPENRDKQVSQSLDEIEKKLRDVNREVPNYWPLQSHLASVLTQIGEFWSLRTTEGLGQARQSLNRATLNWNRLQERKLFVESWKAGKGVYEGSRAKLAEDRKALEAERDGIQKKTDALQAQHDDLMKQADAKRAEAKAAGDESARLMGESKQNPSDLPKLSQALEKRVVGEKATSDAVKLQSDADLAATEINRQQVFAASITARLATIKADDDKLVALIAASDKALLGAPAEGMTAAVPGLENEIADLRAATEAQAKPIVQTLDATLASADKAIKALDEAAALYNKAIARLEQQNQEAKLAAPEVPLAQVTDNASELMMRLELATAESDVGQLKLTLADNARTFEDVKKLLGLLEQSAPDTLKVDAAENRATAKKYLEDAYSALQRASTNPLVTKSDKSAERWSERIRLRREFLEKLTGAAPSGPTGPAAAPLVAPPIAPAGAPPVPPAGTPPATTAPAASATP